MVDIHSHILFGIDDGPETIEESINLLKQAKELGYTDIVCTSHYQKNKFENINYDQNFLLLEEKIKEENLDLKIYKGNEFALIDNSFSNEKLYTLNNSKYLLIELKDNLIFPICKDFFQFLLSKNIIPIFAHIERYHHLSVQDFVELYNLGVILQVNVRFAANPNKKINYLLKNKYIGVLATDTHRMGKRDYNLYTELQKIKTNLGINYFNIITKINPNKIINNENIDIWRVDKDEFKKESSNCNFFINLWNKLFNR